MLASGQIDPRLWGADEFKAHADLCIHCKLCRTECPSAVDVSSLMLEAKAAYVDKHGLPYQRLDLLADRALGAAGEPISDRDQLPAGAATRRAGCLIGCWASRGTGSCRGCGAPRSLAGRPGSV